MIPTGAKEYTLVSTKKPNKTYCLNNDSRITGTISDALQTIQQAVYCILSTERCKYAVYSWDYGVELNDLMGRAAIYVRSELKRRIYEALVVDDRIIGVDNFQFEEQRDALHVTFTVNTEAGNFDYEMVVNY